MSAGGRLGPFLVEAPIAAGAMGEVWRGRHVGQQLPVAIKVLHGSARVDLLDEVEALARLNHPAIARIFDVGVVPSDASDLPEAFAPGRRWLAMELASGGTLEARRGRVDWAELRAILDTVLSGLAHAHANGVLHLDVKPANVLIATSSDLVPGIRLADFGIAMVGHRHAPHAGSPGFMAPEQRTRAAPLGPWTDIYAVGRLACALWTGDPEDRDDSETVHGLAGWLDMALAADPAARFRSAIEAATALPAAEAWSGSHPGIRIAPPVLTVDFDVFAEAETRPTAGGIVAAPDLVPSEQPPPARAGETLLVDTGMALHALRAHDLVLRPDIWDGAWAAAREAFTDGPRGVVLRGTAGMGKTTLAHRLWVALHEQTGARRVVVEGADADLARGVSDLLGFGGLDAGEIRDRLSQRIPWLVPDDLEGWLDVLAPVRDARGRSVRGATERAELIAELLSLGPRPLVLWVDDAHWTPTALGVAERLLDRPSEGPRLVVLTVQEDDLAPDSGADQALQRLGRLPSVRTLALDPVAVDRMTELMSAVPILNPVLQAEIVRASHGVPGVATSLVGSVIASGRQEWLDEKHVARLEANIEAPMAAAWERRVEASWSRASPAARRGMELAAVVGSCGASWREVAGDAADRAILGLRADGLVVPTAAGGWRFTHQAVAEALCARAREIGRLSEHHLACAAALADRTDAGSAAIRATHLLGAGRLEEAWPGVLAALHAAIDRVDRVEALDWLERGRALLDQLGCPPSDPRRGALARFEALSARNSWSTEGFNETSTRYLEASREHGWTEELPWALWLSGLAHRYAGRLEIAMPMFEEALAIPELELAVRARLFGALSGAAADRDDNEARIALLHQTNAIYRQIGDHLGVAIGMMLLSRYDDSPTEQLDEAARMFAVCGDREGLGRVSLRRATLAIDAEQLEEAEHHARAAVRHLTVVGSPRAMDARGWLAMIRLKQGRVREAESIAWRVARGTDAVVGRNRAVRSRLTLAACQLERGDLAALVETLEYLEALDLPTRPAPAIHRLIVVPLRERGFDALADRFEAILTDANPLDRRTRSQ